MKIPNGAIFIWTGTNASIPAGWSRVTSLDTKYPKGTANATNPNTTGGATTHTHTSPSHTHTIAAHTHTITLAAASGGGASTDCNTTASAVGHNHTAFASGAVSSGSVSSVAATYGSVSNDPPYYEVIYITPTVQASNIPTGVIALADATPSSGFAKCDGTGGTPNLTDKYLKGATGGGNAGGTGGSTTNTHALSHTHTTSHAHASATSGGETADSARSQSGAANVVWSHTHAVTLNAATPSTVDNVSLVTAETVEPAYTKLLAMQSVAGAPTNVGIIALWLGNISDIPTGWILCDGSNGTVDMRDRHLKITNTTGHIGNTGGANSHTHASQNHGHTVSHSHTAPNATHGGGSAVRGSGCATATTAATIHTVSTNAVDLVLNNAATTADSSSNEPEYRTVAFIKLVSTMNESGMLMLMV